MRYRRHRRKATGGILGEYEEMKRGKWKKERGEIRNRHI